MNKIYEDLDKKFFIYENIIKEEWFGQIDKEVNEQLNLGSQNIRFAIFDKQNQTTFRINQKNYSDLTEYEKEMYHKKSDESFEIIRNDADINTSKELQEKLNNCIAEIIKLEYNLNDVTVEHASFIHYSPGHFMTIHSDATPHNPRLCTAVLYCNIENKNNVGGDVLFYDNEITQNIVYTYTPKRNQLVIFDSHINKLGIPHSVTTIQNWNRYVYRVYFKTPHSEQNN